MMMRGVGLKIPSKTYIDLKRAFARHHRQIHRRLHTTHQSASQALKRHRVSIEKLRDSAIGLTKAGAISIPLIATATVPVPSDISVGFQQPENLVVSQPAMTEAVVVRSIKELSPEPSGNLSPSEIKALTDLFSDAYVAKVTDEIENHRLNVNYGLIGGEQHLRLYPGDGLNNHTGYGLFPRAEGFAPKNGAYGYFSKTGKPTREETMREKYYFAVQTFLSPGFDRAPYETAMWFRYRKLLAVNPNTGQAVVGVVGDAGPGRSTGKSFGGSPEIMVSLGYQGGTRKGPVYIFFVDDPENKIPLGELRVRS